MAYSVKKSPQAITKGYLHHSCICIRILINYNYWSWNSISLILISTLFATEKVQSKCFSEDSQQAQVYCLYTCYKLQPFYSLFGFTIKACSLKHATKRFALLSTSTSVTAVARGMIVILEDDNLTKWYIQLTEKEHIILGEET